MKRLNVVAICCAAGISSNSGMPQGTPHARGSSSRFSAGNGTCLSPAAAASASRAVDAIWADDSLDSPQASAELTGALQREEQQAQPERHSAQPEARGRSGAKASGSASSGAPKAATAALPTFAGGAGASSSSAGEVDGDDSIPAGGCSWLPDSGLQPVPSFPLAGLDGWEYVGSSQTIPDSPASEDEAQEDDTRDILAAHMQSLQVGQQLCE